MTARRFGKFGVPTLIFTVSLTVGVTAQQQSSARWAEGQPGCAFRATGDGVYRYALATDDFAITLAVDSQELDKARQGIEPVLGLFLSIRFLNQNPARFTPATVTLEFAKHFHEKESPLDTERLSTQLAADREAVASRAAAKIRKRPAQKNDIETDLKDQQRNIDRMIEFLHGQMLRSPMPQDHEIAGWLLFSTRTRWVGQLNKQEEFVLRIPLGTVVAEFPFTLPPSQSDIELRTGPLE
jgi:hypothetical protein